MLGKFKTNLVIFIASILTPFAAVIFLLRFFGILICLLLFFFSFVGLIISTIGVVRHEQFRQRKKYYVITSITAVLLFIFSYGSQLYAADWFYFKVREGRLTTFITELKKYEKIKEMSDGEAFWKSFNFTPIEPELIHVDTSGRFGKKYFLEDILKRDDVDHEHYEFFRQLLIKTGFKSFATLEDGTVSFTINGFLDNCYGIAYSETGNHPDDNDCGQIIRWSKLSGNWYAWSTT